MECILHQIGRNVLLQVSINWLKHVTHLPWCLMFVCSGTEDCSPSILWSPSSYASSYPGWRPLVSFSTKLKTILISCGYLRYNFVCNQSEHSKFLSPGLWLPAGPRVAVGALPTRHQVPLRHRHRGQCPHPRHSQTGKQSLFTSHLPRVSSFSFQLLHIHKSVEATRSTDGFFWDDVCYRWLQNLKKIEK